MRVVNGITLLLFCLPAALACGGNDEIVIARDGVSSVVVVSTQASETEKYAAQELVSYLKQITGGKFNIVNKYEGEQSRILIGADAAKLVCKDFASPSLGDEEFIIRTVGKDLILAGGGLRGTLYAVYTFLEDVLGCRWWTSGASTVPARRTLVVSDLDIRQAPAFELREPCWKDAMNGDWAVRNKVNGVRTLLDKKRGGKYTDFGGGHSFYRILPPNKYFAAHPDWYSLIDGKRVRENGQLCLTNEEMTKEFINNVKEHLRRGPDLDSIWVGQMDWAGYCQCEKCRAIDEREDTPAGSIIYFVNKVAAAIEKDFPDVSISTFAYTYSQKPPRHIKVRDNVIVWLCTTGCSYAHPLTDEINRQFRERLDGWAKVCSRIYIFDYTTNFAHYLCPHPNVRTLSPNVKYYADHNVKGVFSLGGFTSYGAEMAELRAWVLAKLFWDPTRDGGALVEEFLAGYYGPAGKYVREYLDVFHDAAEASNEKLGMYDPPVEKSFLTFSTLSKGLGRIRKGKAAAESQKRLDVVKRLEVAELPLLYVFMLRWEELKKDAEDAGVEWPFKGQSLRDVYEHFNAVVKDNNITEFSEAKARDWFDWIEEKVTVGEVSAPPGCSDMNPKLWADLQEKGFTLKDDSDGQSLIKIVKDDSASNGQAAWMPVNSETPLLKRYLWKVPLVKVADLEGDAIRCKVSVRCELSGKTGIAFKWGVSELWTNEPTIKEVQVRADNVKDGCYQIYDLGSFKDLTGWKYVWVSPADNNKNIKGLWVDRIWLVREEAE